MSKRYKYYEKKVTDWVEKDLIYTTKVVDGERVRTGCEHWRRLRRNWIDGWKKLSQSERDKLKKLYDSLMEEQLPPVRRSSAPEKPRISVSTL